jgi:hypothetical protein
MEGLLVAVVAIYLGATNRRFRWSGAAMLAAVMILAGISATLDAAADARSAGLHFVLTPVSIALGLGEQVVFVALFYGLAALAGWSYRGMTRVSPEPTPHE